MVVQASDRLQLLLDGDKEAGDEGLTLALGLLQAAADILIILRLEPLQSQILQLALERVEAQLMGDGGVEIHTLPALLAALLGREDTQLAHNLQTVGQLDKNHARILRVADNHIAEILGLLLRHLEFYVGNLAQAHDDTQHGRTKLLAYLARERIYLLGVLLACYAQHIVQDSRHGRVTAQTNLACSDFGNGDVVVEHRGAVIACILAHTLGSVEQSAVNALLRFGGVVLGQIAAQRVVFLQNVHSNLVLLFADNV